LRASGERPRRRLIAALLVPGRTAAEVDGIRRALGSRELERIPPHVTVVPPVNVRHDDVDVACDLMRSVAAGFAPFVLQLGPATSFLPRNPVCYLAVRGEPESLESLTELVRQVSTGVLAPPSSRPARPFVPHVTLNQRMDPARIRAAVEVMQDFSARVVFESITLLELSEAVHQWEPVAEAPFRRPAVVGRGGIEIELALEERLGPDESRWAEEQWEQHTLAQYGSEVRPDAPFAITARVNGQLVAAAEGEVRGLTCHLRRLMVDAGLRGAGVGGQLLRAVEDHAASVACARVRLEVMAGGRAEGFYRERGYVEVAVVPLYRAERDFVVMERQVRWVAGESAQKNLR
jgi:2'-5' RNA ligase/ribosomal protein S18 acetylase RimI-like enzyme